MQVFKQYFKIIRKSVFWSLIMYAFIFIAMTIMFSSTGSNTSLNFETTKCDVAIINEDNSILSKKLEEYITSNSNIIDIENNEEAMRDSLFFRESELIVIIPEGFGDAFGTDTPITLETQSIPDSTSSVFVKNMINSYLTSFNLYTKGSNVTDVEKIHELILQDLNKETQVNLTSKDNLKEKTSTYYYFNYLSYPLLCILILGIALVSGIFNSEYLKMRNLCAPLSISKFNLQLFLGHLVLAIITWLIFIGISFIMYSGEMMTLNGVFQIVNSLLFTITALTLSFFIGNIATKTSVYAICNCVALGSCFLGGAFVPQEALSDFVLKLSLINPVYWYIKANDTISTLSTFTPETLKPILFQFMILIAFSLTFLSVGLVTLKYKSLNSSHN